MYASPCVCALACVCVCVSGQRGGQGCALAGLLGGTADRGDEHAWKNRQYLPRSATTCRRCGRRIRRHRYRLFHHGHVPARRATTPATARARARVCVRAWCVCIIPRRTADASACNRTTAAKHGMRECGQCSAERSFIGVGRPDIGIPPTSAPGLGLTPAESASGLGARGQRGMRLYRGVSIGEARDDVAWWSFSRDMSSISCEEQLMVHQPHVRWHQQPQPRHHITPGATVGTRRALACPHSTVGTQAAAAEHPPTSAPGLGSPLPHLYRDWARPCHICTGTGLAPATSAPGPGSTFPHLRRDSANASHICAGTPPRASRSRRRTPERSALAAARSASAAAPARRRATHRSGASASCKRLKHSPARRSGCRVSTDSTL